MIRVLVALFAVAALVASPRVDLSRRLAFPRGWAGHAFVDTVADAERDTVAIYQNADRRAPTIVLRIPQPFRFRSSIGQTQALGINLITFYPDFTSLADPSTYPYGSGCIGYCNGQMMISIENVPADWSGSRQKRMFDEGYLGQLKDHKPRRFGIELEDISPILGFDKVFDERLADGMIKERILLKDESRGLAPLSVECSMNTAARVCDLYFTLKCAPVVSITIAGWEYDHLADAFQLQEKVDDFVSAMLVRPQCNG